MIDELHRWVDTHKAKFQDGPCALNFHLPEKLTPKPGAYIEIVSETRMARLTVWVTGECEEEALDIKTGNTIFSESHQFQSADQLQECLEIFVNKIGC